MPILPQIVTLLNNNVLKTGKFILCIFEKFHV